MSKAPNNSSLVQESDNPAPGEYTILEPLGANAPAITISKSNVPNDYLSQELRRTKDTPGVGYYNLPARTRPVKGGKFSNARVASETDKAMARGRELPGPGDYVTLPELGTSSGTFGLGDESSDSLMRMALAEFRRASREHLAQLANRNRT